MDVPIEYAVRELVRAREQALKDVEGLPGSRATARALGAPLYYPGAPCRFMHVSPRRTLNARCRDCVKADAIKVAARKKPVKPMTAADRSNAAARKAKAEALDVAREAKRLRVAEERTARARSRVKAKAAATRAARQAEAAAAPKSTV